MKTLKIIAVAIFLTTVGYSFPSTGVHAQQGHDQHGGMQHQAPMDAFEHHQTVEGVRAEFQVMSLESMNMSDPGGATHHVMVRFSTPDNDQPITDAVGKVKVIAPDGNEQVQTLTNYNGTFAANFKIDQPGDYGVICLFKTDGEPRVVKFWYPHGKS